MTLHRAARLAVLPALLACVIGAVGSASATPTGAHPTYLVGASIADPDLGALPIQRVFRDRIGAAPDRLDVVSFRTWDDADVRAFVRTAPTGTVLSWRHEPEDEIAAGKASAQDWAAHVVELTRVIQQEGRVGEVIPATILMRWTLSEHSRRQAMLDTLLSPTVIAALRATHGVLSFDAYGGRGSSNTPEGMYGVVADFAASKGLAWGISETGAIRADPTRWTRTFDYLDSMANPPQFFLAWNPQRFDRGVYAIQDQPAVAAVWRIEIAAHRG